MRERRLPPIEPMWPTRRVVETATEASRPPQATPTRRQNTRLDHQEPIHRLMGDMDCRRWCGDHHDGTCCRNDLPEPQVKGVNEICTLPGNSQCKQLNEIVTLPGNSQCRKFNEDSTTPQDPAPIEDFVKLLERTGMLRRPRQDEMMLAEQLVKSIIASRRLPQKLLWCWRTKGCTPDENVPWEQQLYDSHRHS